MYKIDSFVLRESNLHVNPNNIPLLEDCNFRTGDLLLKYKECSWVNLGKIICQTSVHDSHEFVTEDTLVIISNHK